MCNFLSSDFIANTRKYKRKKIKSRLSHVKRTKNIISIPIVNLPEKNVVKVDDFIIYEEIDNISDPNENLKGILNDSNKYRSPSPSGSRRSHNSFDELDYKIMNDKSISNKLINAYAHVENFYTNKYGSTMLKKACRGCNITNFHSNDLLRFKNFSELLHYLKYSFVFKRELLKCEKEMFDHNKRHLFDFYENFFSKKEEIYKNPATICKFCFMQILNRPNYMEEIKRIFIETQNKQPVSVNVAVEGKDMNITIINNYNEVKHTNSSKVSSFDNNISQTFNDKPSNTSKPFTENPFFVINNKIIVTLDELSKQVFNLNYRTREIGCSAIDQQAYRTINAKVDELRSLVSSIFPFIAEHKEYLNKLMETFCQIYENKEFEVDERLRKEINNIHLKLIQLVEENNSYCGKYMEFIRTLASLCYNLLLQLNNQFSTLGLIQAINRNCRNFNLC